MLCVPTLVGLSDILGCSYPSACCMATSSSELSDGCCHMVKSPSLILSISTPYSMSLCFVLLLSMLYPMHLCVSIGLLGNTCATRR